MIALRIVATLVLVVGLTRSGLAQVDWRTTRPPDHQFTKPVFSWTALKRSNIVMQREEYSCGAAAMATVIKYFWGDDITEASLLSSIIANLSEDELRDRLANGLSITDLRQTAVRRGYLSTIGRINLEQLQGTRIPVIVRISKDGFDHFVVVRGFIEDRVFLADPIRGNLRIHIDDFRQQWTDGVVLVIVKPNTPLPAQSGLLVQDNGRRPNPEAEVGYRSLYLPPPTSLRSSFDQ